MVTRLQNHLVMVEMDRTMGWRAAAHKAINPVLYCVKFEFAFFSTILKMFEGFYDNIRQLKFFPTFQQFSDLICSCCKVK